MRPTLQPLAAAIAALLGSGVASAQFIAPTTVPTLPTLRAGSATVVTNGATATQTITQTTARAAIDWVTFGIGRTAQVIVNQPSAQSVLLNRAVGAPGVVIPSYIEGALTANGRVFIINSAGVLFGADARVNVGGLLASTLDLAGGGTPAAMTAFLTAASIDLAASGAPSAVVVLPASSALPQIQAGPGGEVILIGNAEFTANISATLPGITPAAVPLLGSVTHAGNIATQAGRVHLAAGDAATVSLPIGSSGFVSLALVGPANRGVGVVATPTSIISNPGGTVTLEAVSQAKLDSVAGPGGFAAGPLFSSTGAAGTAVVLADGTISARNGSALPTSSVNFTSTGAATFNLVSGSVDVSGSSATASGGSINANAQYIGLLSLSAPATTPVLDASGPAGGGAISLGGNKTRLVQVTETSQIRANATSAGDGGPIVLDASYYNGSPSGTPVAVTDFGVATIGGRIEATGRGSGHHGGSVTTSGAALNLAAPVVDASGANGATPGQWTIDPYDVLISNGPSVGVTAFTPTAVGATIRAADIDAALDAGSNVLVSTGSGGPAFNGAITIGSGVTVQRSAGAPSVALTLAAADSVVMRAGSRIATSAGPLDVNLFADSDASGNGGVRLSEGGSSIATRGGSIVMSGGLDPTTGLARGSAVYDAGVDLQTATLDTRGPAGTGNLTLRGVGYIGSGYDTPGVRIVGSTIDANDISVLGRSGNNDAVLLGTGARLATGAGTIDIRGIADPTASIASDASIGVEVASGAQLLTGNGVLRLAGRGAAVGTLLGDVLIASNDNAGTRISVAGEATAGTRGGIELTGGTAGLEFRGASGANAFSGADIVIGAKAGPGATDAISFGDALPRVLTHGHLNLRPLGVDANGTFVEDVATPIYIGDVPSFATSPPTDFIVRSIWLTPVVGASAGTTADAGIVIGSSLERGRITLDNATPLGAATLRLSLQNEGAGSAGIGLGASLTANQLGLLTGGDVAQSAPLNVSQLLVRGGAASNIDVSNAGNRIAALAFDPPRSLTVRTLGDLTVGGAAAPAFDATSETFATLTPAASQAGAQVLLQSLDASLILGQPIAMLGAGSQLDLVAATLFQNPAGATLSNGAGGAWHVWSDSWTGSARGGLAGSAPAANLYGCAYGDTSTCSLSGVAIPAGGNRFYYRSRPTLSIAADAQTVTFGAPIPPLTYATSGLVNGDAAAAIVSGAPSTLATSTSPPARFSIDVGSLAAGSGYRLAFVPSTLDVIAPTIVADGLTSHFDFKSVALETRSDVYGVNFSLPNVCTAASTLRDAVDADARGAPPLAIEWSRLRNQPQLTSCLNLREAGDCAAF
jgi:filamentous hemagglutinin family protein